MGGRRPLTNVVEYHGALFAVFFLIRLMLIYFFGAQISSSFFPWNANGFNKNLKKKINDVLRVEDTILEPI